MDKNLIGGQIGTDAKYEIKIVDAKLRLEITYNKDGYEGGFFVVLPAQKLGDAMIDGLEKIIPGDQTGIAQGLKEALAKQLAA